MAENSTTQLEELIEQPIVRHRPCRPWRFHRHFIGTPDPTVRWQGKDGLSTDPASTSTRTSGDPGAVRIPHATAAEHMACVSQSTKRIAVLRACSAFLFVEIIENKITIGVGTAKKTGHLSGNWPKPLELESGELRRQYPTLSGMSNDSGVCRMEL